jgi:hypothetical protein
MSLSKKLPVVKYRSLALQVSLREKNYLICSAIGTWAGRDGNYVDEKKESAINYHYLFKVSIAIIAHQKLKQ